VVLTPPEGSPAEVERPAEAAMAAAAPLGTAGVDSVDESDDGLGDKTAITFR
jgi:hypothetical protein